MLRRLALEWVRQNHEVTVLTTRNPEDLPAHQVDNDVEIVRNRHIDVRYLGTLCYMRKVAKWVKARQDSFDVVYVSMHKHSAGALASTIN